MASSSVFPFENSILNELVEALFDIKTRTLIGGGDGGNVTTSSDPIPPLLPAAAIPKNKRSRRITMKGILDSYYEKENVEENPMWVSTSTKTTKKKRKFTSIRVKGSKKKMKPENDSVECPPKYRMEAITSTKFKLIKLQHSETERHGGKGLNMVTFDDKKYDRKGKHKVEDIEHAEESISSTKKAKLMSASQLEAMNYCFSQLEVGQTNLLASPSAQRTPFKPKEFLLNFVGQEFLYISVNAPA